MLSIIIVNYNVKYFLEQCLYSVQKAAERLETEIIVIDNHSTDGSMEYLQPLFPLVRFVQNRENTGFGRACNLGWRMSKGNDVLFLNPDTLIQENTLQRLQEALHSDAAIGAVGLHMVDENGRFLPESKRGFPSPAASFYKMSGLIKLFPRSKKIAQYYMGHLPPDKNNFVEVLSGACMMVKKEVLEKTGGFDEAFFMYGEDIDLSYLIRQAGYKNYYLGDTTIVHFKGKSTPGSGRYVKEFYRAMHIFVKKHFKKQSWWFVVLLQAAIWLRQGIAFFPKKQPRNRRSPYT